MIMCTDDSAHRYLPRKHSILEKEVFPCLTGHQPPAPSVSPGTTRGRTGPFGTPVLHRKTTKPGEASPLTH